MGLYEFEDTDEVRHPLGLYRDFLSGRLDKIEENDDRLVVEDRNGERRTLYQVPDPSEDHDRTEAEQRFLDEYRAEHSDEVADGLILAQARLLGEI
jgi:hypothetical protein